MISNGHSWRRASIGSQGPDRRKPVTAKAPSRADGLAAPAAARTATPIDHRCRHRPDASPSTTRRHHVLPSKKKNTSHYLLPCMIPSDKLSCSVPSEGG